MKRCLILICACGTACFLFASCRKEHSPQALHIAKQSVTNTAPTPPVPEPAPVKAPREPRPGTLAYLDLRNGFRDVTLGEKESSISNLILKCADEARQIKTFTRPTDDLTLEGTPLESIEYNFFKGQLLEVQVKWTLDYRDNPIARPPATDVSTHCTAYYGPPTKNDVTPTNSEYVWRGEQAELILFELRQLGVPNRTTGGWTVPPRTTGRMVIRSLPLARTARAAFITENLDKPGGL